jgi:outer membrane protein W
MNRSIGIAIAAGALACVVSSTASAQQFEGETTYMRRGVAAPRNAFEIGVDTGYTQGFGNIQRNLGVGDRADAGIAFGLDMGWRASPVFYLGAHGDYQSYNADDRLSEGTSMRGVATSIQADFHLAPYTRVDPWLGIGAGYRLLWTSPDGPDNNLLTHGFQLAKLRVGADIRVTDSVAVGPMIGADINMFVWNKPEGRPNVEIDGKRVSTFIYAGLQGRFDLGGERTKGVAFVANR